jgi:hypothetical protein
VHEGAPVLVVADVKTPVASSPIDCGFVPSLEAMPLLSLGSAVKEESWHYRAFPSYGRVLRNLLTSELAAGLVPWELFVTEVLARPAQKGLWSVPLVVHACPTELVLSRRAKKAVYQSPSKRSAGPVSKLVFAIEARRSLTKLQIASWLNVTASVVPENSQFKVLPMELMLKGLQADEIDGFVAPTPWGLLAESHGHGIVDSSFNQGDFSQELVLVCQRRVVALRGTMFKHLPRALGSARARLESRPAFTAAARDMGSLGGPVFDASLLEKAATLYQHPEPQDFAPNSSFILQMLQRLAKFSLLQPALGDLNALSRELAC